MKKSLFCLKCGKKLAEDAKICDNCQSDTSKSPNPLKIEITDINYRPNHGKVFLKSLNTSQNLIKNMCITYL
ncbi:MAG: hypothetical protein HWN67_09535 [Candidatus Helarchaeota archaeon]|nr:hypothetical protein [Candidatus Helarchaeota archaeon]